LGDCLVHQWQADPRNICWTRTDVHLCNRGGKWSN